MSQICIEEGQNANLVQGGYANSIHRNTFLGDGDPPNYLNVDIKDGHVLNTWLDALQVSNNIKIDGDGDSKILLIRFLFIGKFRGCSSVGR